MTAAFGLVLGAGGTVGMAYHAGVLHALREEAGIDPAAADLVVGTSAGALVGASLRSGLDTKDLWLLAHDEHPTQTAISGDETPWRRAWSTPFELTRRVLGAGYVLSRILARGPGPRMPATLRRRFPGGFYTVADAEERLGEMLPVEWPGRPLWLCAVDIASGRRVVLGRDPRPRATLHEAVLASSAIPGFFEPIRTDGVTLVDGGVHSTTNLDLAARYGCRLIVAVVPMAYDPRHPPRRPIARMMRQPAVTQLGREVARARGVGADVLLLRPTAEEIRIHGTNMMRVGGTERVTSAAYEATRRTLAGDHARRVLETVAAA